MRQAIRRKRNCLWFDRLDSLKTSRYLSLSCPTVMWRRASISSRRPVDLLVSVFIVLTSSHMRAGILGTVNFLPERFGEAQAHVGGGKYGGDLAYGLGAIRIAVVHERSPWRPPTTMSASRSSAVWWGYRRGRFRVRSLYTQGTWKMSHSGAAISRGR